MPTKSARPPTKTSASKPLTMISLSCKSVPKSWQKLPICVNSIFAVHQKPTKLLILIFSAAERNKPAFKMKSRILPAPLTSNSLRRTNSSDAVSRSCTVTAT